MLRTTQFIGGIVIASVLSGCGITQTISESLPDRRLDYKKSTTIPTLEIPPDLTSSTINDELLIPDAATGIRPTAGSTLAQQRAVLPLGDKITVERDGQRRWLLIDADIDHVWDKVHDFWLEKGFLLSIDNPTIGILETEWAENRAEIPQDGLRKYLGKVIDIAYSTASRDKFRVRLERDTAANKTALYLTHRRAEEATYAEKTENENFIWQVRPADPELEAEMLSRLMIFLGTEEKRARSLVAQPSSKVDQATLKRAASGAIELTVLSDLDEAWQRVGFAIDRVGFTVEDRDSANSTYWIRYIDPEKGAREEKGILSRWFGSNKEENPVYKVRLVANNDSTFLHVLNEADQKETSDTAEKIYTLLYEQLK